MSKRLRRTIECGIACATLLTAFSLPALADVLQGGVSKTGTMMLRLARPATSNIPLMEDTAMPAVAPDRRLTSRATSSAPLSGLVDTSKFRPEANLKPGYAQSDNIPGFDLGADKGSRELKLAWEQWHKQFSKAIYDNWSKVADEPGRATLRVQVTRNRQVTIAVVSSTGSRRFDRVLIDTIQALQGNPGLTFPSKSQRNVVAFEADYMAASNVDPGYSWVKDDYETVKSSY